MVCTSIPGYCISFEYTMHEADWSGHNDLLANSPRP